MIIQSTRLGEIEVQENQILQFPKGIPGFAEERVFVLLSYQQGSPFFILQSASDPDLAFVLIEPFAFFADYEFELDDEAVKELALSEQNRPEVYCIVTIPQNVTDMTANLVAPIIVSRATNNAMQLVLEKGVYTTKHRLLTEPGSDSKEAR